MYAEIRTDKEILINRLDDSERLLLEEICNNANTINSKITMSKLTDSTGEFGGVLVYVVPGGPTKIELNPAAPTKLDLPIGENAIIVFNTNVPNNDVRILTYLKSTSVSVETDKNAIHIEPTDTQTLGTQTLYYTIAADNCESYNGLLDINIVARDKANLKVLVTKKDSSGEELTDCTITIKDVKDTSMVQNEDKTFDLPVGDYNIEISKEGYTTLIDTLTIASEDLNVAQVIKTFELIQD